MVSYVFNPKAMAIDAAVGLVVFVVFRLMLARHPSLLEITVMGIVAMSLNQWILGPPPSAASRAPTGYVGQLVAACEQEATATSCACAVDTLGERLGKDGLTRLAFRASVNLELPPEFTAVLADCSN